MTGTSGRAAQNTSDAATAPPGKDVFAAASGQAPAVHGDAGLQPERTSLSWTRTVLATLAASAITLRWSDSYGPAVLVLFSALVVLALTIVARQRARYRHAARGLATGRLEANVAAVGLMTLVLTVLGGGGIALVLAAA